MKAIAIQLLCNLLWSTPRNLAVETQADEVHGAGQQGEGRMIKGFVGFGIAPSLDGEIGEGATILGAYGGEE